MHLGSNCIPLFNYILVEEEHNNPVNVLFDTQNDIGLWPEKIGNDFREYWLEKGNESCRNLDSDFEQSAKQEGDRTRHCTKSLFTRTHSLSGEKIDLKWLCYSESKGKVYCFVCIILMSSDESLFTKGCNNWKNAR